MVDEERARLLKPETIEIKDLVDVGRKGEDGKWNGCTKEFILKTEKRRKKDKAAKKSKKKNRKR